MKKINYEFGDHVNGLIYLYCVAPHISPSRKLRKAMFKCYCGKEFEAIIRSVVSENTKSCGCFGYISRSKRFKIHGLRNDPIYSVWCSIKTRCTNKNRLDYKYYGGSGINISDEFKNNFSSFYEYVTSLNNYDKRIKEKLTIDRIDNTKNYERGNLRWATRKAQANKRRNNV